MKAHAECHNGDTDDRPDDPVDPTRVPESYHALLLSIRLVSTTEGRRSFFSVTSVTLSEKVFGVSRGSRRSKSKPEDKG
jgi:hypothetical protein